jgi:hypothetical protein
VLFLLPGGLFIVLGLALAVPGVVPLLPWLRRLQASTPASEPAHEPVSQELHDSRPRTLVVDVPPDAADEAASLWPRGGNA